MYKYAHIVVSAVIAVLGAAGCDCGGSTLGQPCDVQEDCDPGQYCDPATLTCSPIGTDAASDAVTGSDSGMGTDAGPTGTDSGSVCVDLDGDGVTNCDGDCDDGDPLTYPGALEVCGDGVTNDCNSLDPPDTGCLGLGTYVAPPPVGSDANPGTQALPVETINEGILHAMMIGGGVDVYVAADATGPGIYAEDITMVEGISLLGGYESSGWTRDPSINITVIDSTNPIGVLFPHNTTRITAIDGFTINGQTGPGTAAAITVEDNAAPEIANNVINGPSTGGASIGIEINPAQVLNSAVPLVIGNVVNLGPSASGWGPNTGANGIRARDTDVELIGNQIFLANAPTIQTGIGVFTPPAGSLIVRNLVRGFGSAEVAFGLSVSNGFATVDGNDVDPGNCFVFCVGISASGGWDPTVIVISNNIAFGGTGPETTALSISFEVAPPMMPDILVHSNYFNGGGMPGPAGTLGTSVGINFGELPATQIIVGRLYNNAVNSGVGANRYAVREQDPDIDPELVDSNALVVDPTGSFLDGALYRDEGGTNLTTAMMVNAVPTHMNNLDDDCMVTMPVVGGDFHLLMGSNCIDAGSAAELPMFDFEGDMRPMGGGPDIGVDETIP